MKQPCEQTLFISISSGVSIFFELCALILLSSQYEKVKKLRYLKLIFILQLSDLLSCLGGVIGLQRTGTFGCAYQYYMTSVFPVFSLFVGYTIARELYYTICLVRKIPDGDLRRFLLCSLLIALIVPLLPLSTQKVGVLDVHVNGDCGEYGWCFLISSGDGSPLWLDTFWIFFTNYFWVALACISFCMYFLLIYLSIKKMSSKEIRAHARMSLYKLSPYPVIITISAGVSAYYDAELSTDSTVKDTNILSFLNFGFPFLKGALNTLSFFATNKELVYYWGCDLLIYFKLMATLPDRISNDCASEFDHTEVPSERSIHSNTNVTEMTSSMNFEDSYGRKGEWGSTFEGQDIAVKNPIGEG